MIRQMPLWLPALLPTLSKDSGLKVTERAVRPIFVVEAPPKCDLDGHSGQPISLSALHSAPDKLVLFRRVQVQRQRRSREIPASREPTYLEAGQRTSRPNQAVSCKQLLRLLRRIPFDLPDGQRRGEEQAGADRWLDLGHPVLCGLQGAYQGRRQGRPAWPLHAGHIHRYWSHHIHLERAAGIRDRSVGLVARIECGDLMAAADHRSFQNVTRLPRFDESSPISGIKWQLPHVRVSIAGLWR